MIILITGYTQGREKFILGIYDNNEKLKTTTLEVSCFPKGTRIGDRFNINKILKTGVDKCQQPTQSRLQP
jgi:hypothetical protein